MAKIENNPTVSVVIPTHNRAHLIGRAIQSVLAQNYRDFEINVVDDCSTDDTEEIVNDFSDERLRYIRLRENSGGSAAPRNIGLNASRGEYIAALDDDDFWYDENKLKKQVEFLDTHPDHVLLGTNSVTGDNNNTELSRSTLPEKDDEIREKMLEQNCFIHSSVMFRKSAAMIFGGYSQVEGTSYSDDYELWLRLGTIGKLANLPIYGVKYTIMPMHSSFCADENNVVLCVKNIKLIKKYKDKYPNYGRAICFQFVNLANAHLISFSELSPISAFKKNLKSRCPNIWRATTFSHNVFIQILHQTILGILYVLEKLFRK